MFHLNLTINALFNKQFLFLIPEIILLITIFSVVFVQTLKIKISTKKILEFIIFVFLVIFLFLKFLNKETLGFDFEFFFYTFKIENYTILVKQFLLIFGILVLLYFFEYNKIFKNYDHTYFNNLFLVLTTVVLSSFLVISSNDLILLFLSLELISICLYILFSMNKNVYTGSETSLKYFIYSSFSSTFSIFGISIIYGVTGSTNFFNIGSFLFKHDNLWGGVYDLPLTLGLFFLLVAFLFKVTAAPFHFWIAEIYSNLEKPVLFFVLSFIKFLIVCTLVKLFLGPFVLLFNFINKIILFIAILSTFSGVLGAVFEDKIKGFLAFGSVNQIGFILIGLSVFNIKLMSYSLLYLTFYLLSLTLFFFSLTATYEAKKNTEVVFITDFKESETVNGYTWLAFIISLISMAGIPPVIGFFTKFLILLGIFKNGLFISSALMFSLSLISAFYYFRIIKNTLRGGFKTLKWDIKHITRGDQILSLISTVLAVILVISPIFLNYLIWYFENFIMPAFIVCF